jgi:hypothetical protein
MARQFNGSTQALQSASAIDLSGQTAITVAFWMYWDAFANDDDLAMELTANQNTNPGSFIVDPNNSLASGTFSVGIANGAGSYWADRFTRPSATAWHHYLFEMNRATPANLAWVDNIAQTLTAQNRDAASYGAFANALLNLMSRNAASLFGAGRLAEVAIYSGALSAGERSDLQTKAPNVVGTPLFHWPLCGTASPEPAAVGGVNLTVVNDATFVADPLILTGSTCVAASGPTLPFRTTLGALRI